MEWILVYVKSHKASARLFLVQLEAQLGIQYCFSTNKETDESDPQHMGMFRIFCFFVCFQFCSWETDTVLQNTKFKFSNIQACGGFQLWKMQYALSVYGFELF